jgi:hypothetical protein
MENRQVCSYIDLVLAGWRNKPAGYCKGQKNYINCKCGCASPPQLELTDFKLLYKAIQVAAFDVVLDLVNDKIAEEN